MMLLVAYDLHPSPGRDYAPIEDAIKAYGNWAHVEGSVWVIDTLEAPKSVTEKLHAIGHEQDTFLVARLHQNWWSKGLSNTVISWLKDSTRRW